MDNFLDYTPWGLLMKARNQAIDTVFYDVSSLTFDEWLSLNPLSDRKGKIIVVSPSGSGKPIRHYSSALQFAASSDWNTVFAIAIAGVGSSAIGTAALARNVADACNGKKDADGTEIKGDVAGIISGYGVSDVVQEGLGGWYFYGKLDQFRYDTQNLLKDLGSVFSEYFARGTDVETRLKNYFGNPLEDFTPFGPDVHVLDEILSWILYSRIRHENTSLRLLVGHSKGDLLISNVLNHISDELSTGGRGKDLAIRNLAVVTLGAVVDLPSNLIPEDNQHQFLGTLDSLGYANSRSTFGDLAPRNRLPGKWHTTNRRFLGHMDVLDILRNNVPIPGPIPPGTAGMDDVVKVRTEMMAAALKRRAGADTVLQFT